MTRTLCRLIQMSAARVEFGRRGMLHGDALTAARLALGDPTAIDKQRDKEHIYRAARDAQEADDDHEHITIGERTGMLCHRFAKQLS